MAQITVSHSLVLDTLGRIGQWNGTNGIGAVHKIKLVSWGRVLQTNPSSDQNLKGRYINRSRPLGRETSGK